MYTKTLATNNKILQLIASSRNIILSELQDFKSFVFFRNFGNIGDRLIQAGTRQLIRNLSYVESDIRNPDGLSGDVAVIGGGGGWCLPWHLMPRLVEEIEQRFKQVIILPSSFQVSEPSVDKWLRQTQATIFVREQESLRQVSLYRSAILALDCAFFFNFEPYLQEGIGKLHAFRTDREKKNYRLPLPDNNTDISVTTSDLDHWLHTIARHQEIATDRAHVMIAGSMMGKRVFYCESSYHKLQAIADYALQGLNVTYKDNSII
jgi:exopolysaccharide biosynthesis predicted pyruvyltransferase EpsI